MNIWLVVLLCYAVVWTIYGIARLVKRAGSRPVPGPWRVTGRNDLMGGPNSVTWFADNAEHKQTRGPFTSSKFAQEACNRLNRESGEYDD